MRRREMKVGAPADAAAIPGFQGWRYWMVEHVGSTYTTHRVYMESTAGAVVGPCDWNPNTGWFNSAAPRRGWTNLVEPFVVDAHDVIGVVHDTLLESIGQSARTPWLLDVHRPQYSSYTYLLSILAQKGFKPAGLTDTHPGIAGTFVSKSWEQHQLEALRPWMEKHPEACPFPLYDVAQINNGWSGPLLVAAAACLRGLLSDGQWHSYHDVRRLVEQERHPNGYPVTPLSSVAVWGDEDYRREWQAPVYVLGRANHIGRYVAWDSETAQQHRAMEHKAPEA